MEKFKSFTKDIIDINFDASLAFIDTFAKFSGFEKNTYTENVKNFVGSVRENAKQIIEGTCFSANKK